MSERESTSAAAQPPPTELAEALAQLVELLAERVARRQAELARESRLPQESSPWLSIESAARYLDWPRQRLYKLSASGAIPHYKHERRLIFRRDELDEWLRGYAQAGRGDSG